MALLYEQVKYNEEKAKINLKENDWSNQSTNGKDDENGITSNSNAMSAE